MHNDCLKRRVYFDALKLVEVRKSFIVTYIHNWSLQLSDRLRILLMMCVLILYMSGGTNNLKSTPNERLFA